MNWFDTVSNFFEADYYTTAQVKVFVVKGKITAEQYQQITGEAYIA